MLTQCFRFVALTIGCLLCGIAAVVLLLIVPVLVAASVFGIPGSLMVVKNLDGLMLE